MRYNLGQVIGEALGQVICKVLGQVICECPLSINISRNFTPLE